jgi:hypothetical protein
VVTRAPVCASSERSGRSADPRSPRPRARRTARPARRVRSLAQRVAALVALHRSSFGGKAATIASVTINASVSTILQALQSPAVAVSEVLRSPELLPAASGFYGWWSLRGALPGLPQIRHPFDEDVSLLYVGISPARETSRQTIRSRVIGNHLNGNVGSSTFRFVLAAFLLDALGLHPYLRGTKVALSRDDNRRLSAWQREHLLLASCARERPWEVEREVIAQLAPPLNSAGNAAHAAYPMVRAARAEFRRRARGALSPSATPRTI